MERVGRRDNFFELGGHSLLALRLVGHLRSSGLAIEASLARLLKTQTIAGYIAAEGEATQGDDVGPPDWGYPESLDLLATSLNRCTVPNAAPLFMVHEGRGAVLDYVTLAQVLADTCPVVGLSLDATHVPPDMMQIARLHAETIGRIQPAGALRVAGWSLGGALAPLIAKVLEDEGRELAWVGAIDPYTQVLDQEEVSAESFAQAYVRSLVPEGLAEAALADTHVSAWLDEVRQDGENAFVDEQVRVATDHARSYGRSVSLDCEQRQEGELQLGSDELADLFVASWRLHKAADVPCEGVRIRAPMTIWWADRTSALRRKAFSDWASCEVLEERVLPEDHGSIIRSDALIAGIASILRQPADAR